MDSRMDAWTWKIHLEIQTKHPKCLNMVKTENLKICERFVPLDKAIFG